VLGWTGMIFIVCSLTGSGLIDHIVNQPANAPLKVDQSHSDMPFCWVGAQRRWSRLRCDMTNGGTDRVGTDDGKDWSFQILGALEPSGRLHGSSTMCLEGFCYARSC
jgi:hypothetical protein